MVEGLAEQLADAVQGNPWVAPLAAFLAPKRQTASPIGGLRTSLRGVSAPESFLSASSA